MKQIRTPESTPTILTVIALATAVAGCAPTAYKITPVPADRTLEETTVLDEGGFAPAKVALIDVDGIILNSRRLSLFGEGENPVSVFTEKLDKAAVDGSVKAVVLRINSPGGSVTASDLMYREIQYFKARTKGQRPVVTVMMDLTASGGYYLACATDEMIANDTTVTGSIGVIMEMVNVGGTMQKIGITTDAIKSGKMKDAGSPFRQMKPEERELFQSLVNQFYDRFVEVVAKGRKMDPARVRELADGRVYSAREALKLGFIDRIGTLRDALAGLKEKINAKRIRVVTYHRPLGWKPNVYAETPAQPAQMNLLNITLPTEWVNTPPQFLYLWSPGL